MQTFSRKVAGIFMSFGDGAGDGVVAQNKGHVMSGRCQHMRKRRSPASAAGDGHVKICCISHERLLFPRSMPEECDGSMAEQP